MSINKPKHLPDYAWDSKKGKENWVRGEKQKEREAHYKKLATGVKAITKEGLNALSKEPKYPSSENVKFEVNPIAKWESKNRGKENATMSKILESNFKSLAKEMNVPVNRLTFLALMHMSSQGANVDLIPAGGSVSVENNMMTILDSKGNIYKNFSQTPVEVLPMNKKVERRDPDDEGKITGKSAPEVKEKLENPFLKPFEKALNKKFKAVTSFSDKDTLEFTIIDASTGKNIQGSIKQNDSGTFDYYLDNSTDGVSSQGEVDNENNFVDIVQDELDRRRRTENVKEKLENPLLKPFEEVLNKRFNAATNFNGENTLEFTIIDASTGKNIQGSIKQNDRGSFDYSIDNNTDSMTSQGVVNQDAELADKIQEELDR